HLSLLAYLGSAFDRVLAVRTNFYFGPESLQPISDEHVRYLRHEIAAFAPDLIFSVNRYGLAEQVLAAVHPDVRVLTAFLDYYDRVGDDMHQYGPRDLVWGTGNQRIRAAYLRKYAGRLRPEQVVHTLWGADHNLFYPRGVARDTGIIFVGTPF